MSSGRSIAVFLALSLMASAFCAPSGVYRRRRDFDHNQINSKEPTSTAATETKKNDVTTVSSITTSTTEDKSDEDDDFDEQLNSPPSTGGGSNIFTLLNLANALFPASSSSRTTSITSHKSTIHDLISQKVHTSHRRQDAPDNEVEVNYETVVEPKPTDEPKPTFQRQESKESDSETSESQSDSEEDNVAKESIEKESNENSNGDSSSKEDPSSNESDNDSDYDEPEGDGQGGGLLGILGGLSGDGESDLGTLLGTVGGIVANLSGGGVDLNDVIATAIGLFVGLLSDGEENPGEIIARYLQTALETITGGGAQNNGKFFGIFVSKLLKGISAAGEPEESAEEVMPTQTDSGGFLSSLLMGILGDMSKSSFDGSSAPWR